MVLAQASLQKKTRLYKLPTVGLVFSSVCFAVLLVTTVLIYFFDGLISLRQQGKKSNPPPELMLACSRCQAHPVGLLPFSWLASIRTRTRLAKINSNPNHGAFIRAVVLSGAKSRNYPAVTRQLACIIFLSQARRTVNPQPKRPCLKKTVLTFSINKEYRFL